MQELQSEGVSRGEVTEVACTSSTELEAVRAT